MDNIRRHGGTTNFGGWRRWLVADLHEGPQTARSTEQLVCCVPADSADDGALDIIDERHRHNVLVNMPDPRLPELRRTQETCRAQTLAGSARGRIASCAVRR